MSLKNLLLANILLLCNISGMNFNQANLQAPRLEQSLEQVQAGFSQINLSAQDQQNNGDTTLHEAARKNMLGLVLTLLAQGANSWATNRKGELPINVTTDPFIQQALAIYMQANDDINE